MGTGSRQQSGETLLNTSNTKYGAIDVEANVLNKTNSGDDLSSLRLKIQHEDGYIETLNKSEEKVRNKYMKRIVSKKGETNVKIEGLKPVSFRKLRDFFTTFLELSWSSSLAVFLAVYLGSWLGFGCVWWAVARLPRPAAALPCLLGVNTIAAALLFRQQQNITTDTKSCQ